MAAVAPGIRRWIAGALTSCALASPALAAAPAPRLLDVPFLAQPENLCGGAAVAMVMRYWGARAIYPEDFAPLVDRSAAGIATDVLTADVAARGWQTLAVNVSPADGHAWIRDHVADGRPVIALVEVAKARYHYVVVVAWTGTHVIVHDPADAPFVVLSVADFERAWAAARRWALVIVPPVERAPAASDTSLLAPLPAPTAGARAALRDEPRPEPARATPAATSCGPFVASLVALAKSGDIAGADAGLVAAVALCPRDPVARRELAGVRFLQSRWAEASHAAAQAVALDPADDSGWDLLATSRFLSGESAAALEPWNHLGRPTVDVVRVVGASRTRHPVVVGLLDLPPRALLTPERLAHAERRLQELPSALTTRVRYQPVPDGSATIDAVVMEPASLPRGVVPVTVAVTKALLQREAQADVISPTGSGERLTMSWRWWQNRPRVALALAVPSPSWLPGVTTIEGMWERPAYQMSAATPTTPASIARPTRHRASLQLADWLTSRVRWSGGLALDRWGPDSYLASDLGLDLRSRGDRASLALVSTLGAPLGSGRRFASAGAAIAARSTRDPAARHWRGAAGVEVTSTGAPFDLWPGAGTGHGREPLLRAHPLLESGVVTGAMFGRALAHATVEYRHPVASAPIGALHLALFTDAARVWQPLDGAARPRAQVDAGAGLRLALPGRAGTLRLDAARGLRDRQWALSAAWQVER